jgi:hypothetical protein
VYLAWDARQRAEAEIEPLLLEARREAAVLLIMERETFAMELQAREEAIEALRGTNRLLLGQLHDATGALTEAQLMLVANSTQHVQQQRKCFFGLF